MNSRIILLSGALCLTACSRLTPNEARLTELSAWLGELHSAGYECAVAGASAEIPDDSERGLLLGPLRGFDRSGQLGELVLALDIEHAWTGDLRASLHYDVDGDGYADVSAPLEFYTVRPRNHRAPMMGAYPLPMNGLYFMRDEAWSLDPSAAGDLAPSAEPRLSGGADRPFEVFSSLEAGGSFYLSVADTLPSRKGRIRSWAICRREPPGAGG